ncbi:hypothetical protein J2T57_002614 [Natronocella acetinitrilica]|uniref:Uncharacterized protein n=1 Tax=Natronocella acetinitrilica TaxID=414046 RepID=A0AAE3G5L6_9GAMM|nr:hypothetical protein [Natronocella acetinitrilica]MCP1675464.1 hypothetical protein [Natronocella acetinitrilica]
MPVYRLTVMAEFESQAQAEDAMAQMQARATNTRVSGMGGDCTQRGV